MDIDDDSVVERFLGWHSTLPSGAVTRVWSRLREPPHIFEVAQARRELYSYSLQGEKRQDAPTHLKPTQFNYFGWNIKTCELEDLYSTGALTDSTLEIFARSLRPSLSPHQWLGQAFLLHNHQKHVTSPAFVPAQKSFKLHPNQVDI